RAPDARGRRSQCPANADERDAREIRHLRDLGVVAGREVMEAPGLEVPQDEHDGAVVLGHSPLGEAEPCREGVHGYDCLKTSMASKKPRRVVSFTDMAKPARP